VLVESFEEGVGVSKYLESFPPSPVNPKIASIGLNAYMKMMLIDHFVHADLHPGNVLVRHPNNLHMQQSAGGSRFNPSHVDPNETTQLVLLDVGLVTEMSGEDASHFVELFKAIVEGNGEYGSELMIKYARKQPKWTTEKQHGNTMLSTNPWF
jgi:aarF domain-containing kinase